MKRIIALIFCCILVISTFSMCIGVNAQKIESQDNDAVISSETKSYFEYYKENNGKNRPNAEISLLAEKSVTQKANSIKSVESKISVVLDEENTWAEWSFEIIEEGIYCFFPNYYQLKGTNKDISIEIKIDGKVPYAELGSVSLNRLWKDKANADGKVILKDTYGDDLRPAQVEAPRWNEIAICDGLGLYSEPYFVYLERGTHTARITLMSESVAISELKIKNEDKPVSYAEYHSKHTRNDLVKYDKLIYLQAENAIEKNAQTLYPLNDRSSAATMPNEAEYVRLNTIGQTNWNKQGQAISWKVNVPKAGLYKIAFRAKQNYNSGINTYRALYINGKIPFKEAGNVTFEYDQKWQIVSLGGKNSYYVWLEPDDILTLECTTSMTAPILRGLQQSVLDLNKIYRKIIVITGSNPDIYRDYHLEDQIPDLVESLVNSHNYLENIIKRMDELNDGKNPLSSTVSMMSVMAKELSEDTYYIPEQLGSFKSNIESLGSLINTLSEQPLELDYICFVPHGVELPKAEAGFFKSFLFSFRQFLVSFVKDYQQTDLESEKTIDVWVATGRDQAQILKNMIVDTYTANTAVGVNMSLVDTGQNLIKATLAGKGPDVALMIPDDTPVNLAMRGMLLDLKDYVSAEDLKSFRESAVVPYYYNGGLYALPETESYDMIFYRTDIFEELGLKVPENWDEFFSVVRILQSNNLMVGLPEINAANMGVSVGIGTFNKFLFQSGGTYYNEDLSSTLFHTDVAQDAFTKWVELYSLYGLDRSFDFFNCFRSGEMPLGISNFTTYNQISEAAPEIRGLWSFAPVPGTIKPDGTIDRSESSSTTGCIIIKTAQENKVAKEAVEFIRWWTSAETQTRYGLELEATMGTASRYTSASIEAFAQLGWSSKELSILESQSKWLKNVPKIPGNYLVDRSLTNAFRAALNGKNTPARSLLIYNKDICDEITRKREEFGLS